MDNGKKKETLWPETPFKKQVFRKGIIIANSEPKNSHRSSSPSGCTSKDILHSCSISNITFKHVTIKNNKRHHKFAKSPKRSYENGNDSIGIPDSIWDEESRVNVDEKDNVDRVNEENDKEGSILGAYSRIHGEVTLL